MTRPPSRPSGTGAGLQRGLAASKASSPGPGEGVPQGGRRSWNGRLRPRPDCCGWARAAVLALALLVASAGAAQGPALSNRLAGHPSPYLALHAGDATAWQPWGADSKALVQRLGRPMFLSSGYFACHWCHVMQRESFQDTAVAGVLNHRYVPVKLDRETHADVDRALLEFVSSTQGYAGWPLNVLITPEGYPLIGFVYLEPARLREVLLAFAERWEADPSGLEALGRSLVDQLRRPLAAPTGRLDPERALRLVVEQAPQQMDLLEGGFQGVNKFPRVPQLRLLLRALSAPAPPADFAAEAEEFLRVTLDAMAAGGLRDHLGGGFFRYTVDPSWQIPHFEKMLSDNAQLARLYLDAGARLGQPRYTQVGGDTLDFLLEAMRDPADRAFVAALSAVDGEGTEGGYYLWAREALAAAADRADLDVLDGRYRWVRAPELAGAIPVPTRWPLGLDAAARAGVDEALAALREIRDERALPVDTKILAAWNALALQAFVAGERHLGLPRYREAADRLVPVLAFELWDGNRLARARASDGQRFGQAGLGDYALVARALLDWAEVRPRHPDRTAVLAAARELVVTAWSRFRGEGGGWQPMAEPWLAVVAPEAVMPAGPMPSPTAMILEVTLAVAAHHAGDSALAELAARAKVEAHGEFASVTAAPLDYADHVALVLKLAERQPDPLASTAAGSSSPR